MNKFSWYEAKSIEDALLHINRTVSEELAYPSGKAAVLKAGGVDLLDLMKEGLVQPLKVVNILNIPGLDRIEYNDEEGLSLGANVTLADIENNALVKSKYFALYQAVAGAATPQLRNMATLGGNLAQRTRCWYFRSEDHYCLRKGGGKCFAREGENENHAILRNGTCISVHASSISTALMAYNASVQIVNQENESRIIPIEEFFVSPGDDASRENVLEAGEIITEVILPSSPKGTKSYYIKEGPRKSYDWSIADVAVVLAMNGSTCDKASIVLGSAAPVPIRSTYAERVLNGNRINERIAQSAAEASMSRARPLSKNGYKIPLFKAILKEAILNVV